MWNPETQPSSSVSVTSEEVARQIKAATDPLTQQLAHLYESMQELKNEQAHRRHEETASSRTASTSAGSTNRSDNVVILSLFSLFQSCSFKILNFVLLFFFANFGFLAIHSSSSSSINFRLMMSFFVGNTVAAHRMAPQPVFRTAIFFSRRYTILRRIHLFLTRKVTLIFVETLLANFFHKYFYVLFLQFFLGSPNFLPCLISISNYKMMIVEFELVKMKYFKYK